jgi:hypothetical protein
MTTIYSANVQVRPVTDEISDVEFRAMSIPERSTWLDLYDEAIRDDGPDPDEAYERHLESAGYWEARAQEDHERAMGVVDFGDALRQAEEGYERLFLGA